MIYSYLKVKNQLSRILTYFVIIWCIFPGTAVVAANHGDWWRPQLRTGHSISYVSRLNENVITTANKSARKLGFVRQLRVAILNVRSNLNRRIIFELEQGSSGITRASPTHRTASVDGDGGGGLLVFSSAKTRRCWPLNKKKGHEPFHLCWED